MDSTIGFFYFIFGQTNPKIIIEYVRYEFVFFLYLRELGNPWREITDTHAY